MELAEQIIPPTAPHTHTVVFLHGRGDNAFNFMHSLSGSPDSSNLTITENFPSFRWVFPEAKKRPWAHTNSLVNQWFNVWNPKNFKDNEMVQAAGLKESVPVIRAILAREVATLGGRWDRIVLAGISQGAATSFHTLINLKTSEGPDGLCGLGALLGFCCRIPFPDRTLSEMRAVLALDDSPEGANNDVLRKTPVMLQHCVDDPLIPVQLGRDLRATLEGFGVPITWKEYPDGRHWFNSPAGIDDAVQFLKSSLGLPSTAPTALSGVRSDPNAMDLS